MHYHRKPEWAIPERDATPESVFFNRRAFLQGSLGVMAAGAIGLGGIAALAAEAAEPQDRTLDLYPAARNAAFALDRPLTEAEVAAKYNNF
jgi:methionine sulfoxide reductase catalytic subunit